MKKKALKVIMPILFISIMIISSYSMANIKGSLMIDENNEVKANAIYDYNLYAEGIDIFPLMRTAVGVHATFAGGSVNLPLDVTGFDNLDALQLIVSSQKRWFDFAQRRLWDVPDGMALGLAFSGQSADSSVNQANQILEAIEDYFGVNLYLVYGEYFSSGARTNLIYYGILQPVVLTNFIGNFTNYVSNDGFGQGITNTVLASAPVKAMGITLIHEKNFLIDRWAPIIECAWIDPLGLTRTGSILEMNLTKILPDLTQIQGATDSIFSNIRMKLPYVVDVLVIDPDTTNDYPHLRGNFEWLVKVDVPLLNMTWDETYSDIYVKYDLNLTSLRNYPEIIGNVTVDTSKLMTFQTAWRIATGLPFEKEASMCKAWVSESYHQTVTLGHQIMGGLGFMEETDLQLYFKHAKSAELSFGDANFHREILADQMGL